MRDLIAWCLGRRRRYRVAGLSLYPTFAPGQAVLVDPAAYRRALPRPGHVVLAQDPRESSRTVIKRVRAITPGGAVFLVGDHPDAGASTDSRSYGPVAPAVVIGRVVCRLPWPC